MPRGGCFEASLNTFEVRELSMPEARFPRRTLLGSPLIKPAYAPIFFVLSISSKLHFSLLAASRGRSRPWPQAATRSPKERKCFV